MKLCIIGPEKRTHSNLELLEKAKKFFDTVLYVPFSLMSLGNDEIIYKNVDLSKFDSVLPIIPKNRSLFAYSVLNNLKVYSPISPKAYFITSDRFIMFSEIMKNGLQTPKIYLLNSPKSVQAIANSIKFPISIRLSSKEKGIMFANNNTELRAMLDTLETFKDTIYIEEYLNTSYLQIYVIGDDVFGLKRKPVKKPDIFFGEGKMMGCKISDKIKNAAIKTAKIIGTEFARVDMIGEKILNIDLSPPVKDVEKVINMDIISRLLEFIKYSAQRDKSSLFERFLIDIKSLMRNI